MFLILSFLGPLVLLALVYGNGFWFRLDRTLWYGTSTTVIHLVLAVWMAGVAFVFPLQDAGAPDAANPVTVALLAAGWMLVHWVLDLRKLYRQREEETSRRLELEAQEQAACARNREERRRMFPHLADKERPS